MSTKEIRVDRVPGIKIVQDILGSIDQAVSVDAAGYDFDEENYVLKFIRQGRNGRVVLPRNLLDDVGQDTGQKGKQYTRELHGKVESALRKAVEDIGLSPN